jgi:hypothetical protein
VETAGDVAVEVGWRGRALGEVLPEAVLGNVAGQAARPLLGKGAQWVRRQFGWSDEVTALGSAEWFRQHPRANPFNGFGQPDVPRTITPAERAALEVMDPTRLGPHNLRLGSAPSSTRYVVNSGLPPGLPSYTLNNPQGRVSGLLIFQEGGQTRYIRLTSGVNNATDAGLAGARNLPGATSANWHHVEFQALEIMRQRGITNASLLHNYPTGLPCGACMPGGDLTRLQSSLANGNQLSIFGLVPSPAGSTSPWIVSPAGSVRVVGTR